MQSPEPETRRAYRLWPTAAGSTDDVPCASYQAGGVNAQPRHSFPDVPRTGASRSRTEPTGAAIQTLRHSSRAIRRANGHNTRRRNRGVSVSEALEFSPNSVAITFDDGCETDLLAAAAVL